MSNVSVYAQLSSDLEKRLEELGMELKQAKEDLKGKEKLLKERRIELCLGKNQYAQISEQLEEHQRVVQKFKTGEEEMKNIIVEQEREIVNQRDQISILEMQMEKVSNDKLDETGQMVNVHTELINQNKELEKSLDTEKSICQNLQAELIKKMEEASRLNIALGESEKTKEAMENQLLQYAERVNILQEIARDKQSQCNAMQKFLEEDYSFMIDQERNRISQEEARSQKVRSLLLTLNSENFVPIQDAVVECSVIAPSRNTSYVGEETEKVEFTNPTTQSSASNAEAGPSTSAAARKQECSFYPQVDVDDSEMPIVEYGEGSDEDDQNQNQEDETNVAAEAQPSHSSSSAFCNTRKASVRSSKIHGVDHSKRCSCLCGKKYRYWSDLKRHINYHDPQHTFPCGEKNCNMVFSGTYILKKHMRKEHDLLYTKSGCSGCGETFTSISELRAHQKSKSCWANLDAPKGVKAKSRNAFGRKKCTRLSQQKLSKKQKQPKTMSNSAPEA